MTVSWVTKRKAEVLSTRLSRFREGGYINITSPHMSGLISMSLYQRNDRKRILTIPTGLLLLIESTKHKDAFKVTSSVP